jgi:hypothetical protein
LQFFYQGEFPFETVPAIIFRAKDLQTVESATFGKSRKMVFLRKGLTMTLSKLLE